MRKTKIKKAAATLTAWVVWAGKATMVAVTFLWGIGFYLAGALTAIARNAVVSGYAETEDWLER